jgi:hypothetical protein
MQNTLIKNFVNSASQLAYQTHGHSIVAMVTAFCFVQATEKLQPSACQNFMNRFAIVS